MMDDVIAIKLELSTLATLIAGLYCLYAVVDPVAIPQSVYVELCEKLQPYLENWNYSELSFEDWVKYNLIIAPIELFTKEEIEEFKRNEIYFERHNGNIILVATAKVVND